ncbi:MAG: DUF1080 domain-containing protein [Bryobacteraceae bacterium]|nr:DUF1080 domain-containing protein [Bryobacteraceae bacterium]MDW8379451.1 DUF1080 domain-containing protein [Bryobacterales bacterium]
MKIALGLATLALLELAPLFANPKFNGRWDITVRNEPRRRAWWLEIEAAETANPRGKFISAYAGDLNPIEEIRIQGDELTFGFQVNNRGHLVYQAKLVGDRLEGTFEVEGNPNSRLVWTGVRAPVIQDRDDGSWVAAKTIELFNGRDLTGWLPVVSGRELGWKVENGILKNVAGANNILTAEKFWNFDLHAEVRLGPGSNSGIVLRGRYEIQILDDFGKPPSRHSNGALYSRVAPLVNASRPAGEWQTYQIRIVGRQVTVVLNGQKILDKVEAEGLTAAAIDADEALPGPLFLQGDHGAVEFRKIRLTPLVRKGR